MIQNTDFYAFNDFILTMSTGQLKNEKRLKLHVTNIIRERATRSKKANCGRDQKRLLGTAALISSFSALELHVQTEAGKTIKWGI